MLKNFGKNAKWHICAWIVYFLINYYHDIFYEEWNFHLAYYVLSYFFVTMLTFYVLYIYAAPKFFNSYKFVYIGLILFGFVAFRFVLQEYITPLVLSFGNYESDTKFWEFINDNAFKVLIPAAAGTLLYMFEKSKRDEANALKLLNEKNEAELSFLRSQINPHFLFNTMNFLYTKAFRVDENLASSILRLSDVLRYTLKNSETEKVAIQEEINLIKDLIEIFKMRFEGKCFVELNIEGDNFQKTFEPLMLMPFVENAFKHGVYNIKNIPIIFNLIVEENQLVFSVKNKIKHQKKDEVSGIGLTNLKRRLNMMYKNRHELSINDDGEMYFAALKLEL